MCHQLTVNVGVKNVREKVPPRGLTLHKAGIAIASSASDRLAAEESGRVQWGTLVAREKGRTSNQPSKHSLTRASPAHEEMRRRLERRVRRVFPVEEVREDGCELHLGEVGDHNANVVEVSAQVVV